LPESERRETVLVIHPSAQIKTAKEYIAIAEARPGSMQYGSIGLGSLHHSAGEWLKMLTGINILIGITAETSHRRVLPKRRCGPSLNGL
jgi:tripartite-type tricarboxylate transporter receptor subunit TctC